MDRLKTLYIIADNVHVGRVIVNIVDNMQFLSTIQPSTTLYDSYKTNRKDIWWFKLPILL